ncbi:MAG: DUF1887 family CARF protein [Anaerolineae bacterium]|nr:DUF1887 family CARF protein [Anaerolineae bacterium]
MIHLVGEQPAPILLPTRYLNPDVTVLVHTEHTRGIAQRLADVLDSDSNCLLHCVSPYDLPGIQISLQRFLQEKLAEHQLLFNLTGGTKMMSLAAFLVAFQRKAPFVYFQTEGGHSWLYRYQFTPQGEVQLEKREEIGETITLDDYLRVQVGEYTTGSPRTDFESEVLQALREYVPGIETLTSVRPRGMEALEVDFVIRLGNQIGVMEVKARGAKSGIDQIQAVAEQRYLGTYVAKFLVSGKSIDQNNRNLANAYNITVIELTGYEKTRSLSPKDRQTLAEAVRNRLGGAL